MLIQIIASGEQSGELDSMLGKASKAQDRELKNIIGTMLALIGPLTLLLMGSLVLIIVMAMMLPMVSMFDLIM